MFSREPPVEFTLFSCNAKGDSAQHADVVFGMALVAGDRVVLEDPFLTSESFLQFLD